MNKRLEDRKDVLDLLEKKEILKTLRDIKKRLGMVEEKIEEGKFFTFWCVFGSFCITSGFALIGMSIRLDTIATCSGCFMFIGGGSILAASLMNVNKNKKLDCGNPCIRFGFFFVVIGILVLVYCICT